MNYIKNRTYVITGGAVGLGFATAKALAELGGNIVIGNRNEERAKEAVSQLEAMGAKAVYKITDITKEKDCIELMKCALDNFGRIDGVVNSAGIMPLGEFCASSSSKWTKGVDVNINGTINVVHAAINFMLKQEGKIPHIVCYSSTAAKRYLPGAGVYGATKNAIRWIMDSLRPEYAGKIKFTTLYPGATKGTELGKSHGVSEDDKFFGTRSAMFKANSKSVTDALENPELDKPLSFGLPIIIANETVHVLNQPEGVYIEDIIVTFSNDAT